MSKLAHSNDETMQTIEREVRERDGTMDCPHMNFRADVRVGRHLDDKTETHVIGYSAEINVKCQECGKPFQFLGLPMGVDTHGARVSVDGLEARLAISPQGVQPSPINRMQFNISKHDS